RELPGKQDFDTAVQKVARSRVSGTHRLRVQTGSPAVKAGGEDAAVIYHQQVVRSEQGWKIGEAPVGELTRAAPKVKHPGSAAIRQGFLRDQLFGQVKIKIRNQHRLDYIALLPGWSESVIFVPQGSWPAPLQLASVLALEQAVRRPGFSNPVRAEARPPA